MAREGQGYPCWWRDVMMMMITIKTHVMMMMMITHTNTLTSTHKDFYTIPTVFDCIFRFFRFIHFLSLSCLMIVVCKTSWNQRLQTNFHGIKYINLIYIYLSLLHNSSISDIEHSSNYIALGSPQTYISKLVTINTVTIYIYIYIYIYTFKKNKNRSH